MKQTSNQGVNRCPLSSVSRVTTHAQQDMHQREHLADVIVICIIDYTVMTELLTSPDVVSCPGQTKVVSLFACAS
jgi:hypothetical protein